MSEVQRLALIRVLTPRIAALELDAVRLVDHVVTRLELGRERYGDLNLAAPRDWSKELGEELIDALVYQAARELAAQDLARESLREAARAEMFAGDIAGDIELVAKRQAANEFRHTGALPYELRRRTPEARREYIIGAAQAGAITPEVADAMLKAAGDDLAIPVERQVAEFAPDAHLTRVSTEPARIAARDDATFGEPEIEIDGGEG